jgi:hypothetical protein
MGLTDEQGMTAGQGQTAGKGQTAGHSQRLPAGAKDSRADGRADRTARPSA